MVQHGKKYLVDFTDNERHVLKQYFKNLDRNN